MARKGAKLNYLKSLKGDCPEGEEVVYFQKGGNICKKCEKKKQETLKKTNDSIEEFKKGRKTKKCQKGDTIPNRKVMTKYDLSSDTLSLTPGYEIISQ